MSKPYYCNTSIFIYFHHIAGSSMIKVIYRCKTDFCDGETVNKEVRFLFRFYMSTNIQNLYKSTWIKKARVDLRNPSKSGVPEAAKNF